MELFSIRIQRTFQLVSTINIYSFNLGAYKKMLIIHTLEQIKYFIIYHT